MLCNFCADWACGGATKTIRVGSGGVMLPIIAPLVVAEQFGTLEALYPRRIDLGLGRAPAATFLPCRLCGETWVRRANDFLTNLRSCVATSARKGLGRWCMHPRAGKQCANHLAWFQWISARGLPGLAGFAIRICGAFFAGVSVCGVKALSRAISPKRGAARTSSDGSCSGDRG